MYKTLKYHEKGLFKGKWVFDNGSFSKIATKLRLCRPGFGTNDPCHILG